VAAWQGRGFPGLRLGFAGWSDSCAVELKQGACCLYSFMLLVSLEAVQPADRTRGLLLQQLCSRLNEAHLLSSPAQAEDAHQKTHCQSTRWSVGCSRKVILRIKVGGERRGISSRLTSFKGDTGEGRGQTRQTDYCTGCCIARWAGVGESTRGMLQESSTKQSRGMISGWVSRSGQAARVCR